ncbi:MAG: DUF350 domain-containing protein [Spirochaetales bacterium]|nr:DUF350 domain-containing protein [Spirochaetales bacterium]
MINNIIILGLIEVVISLITGFLLFFFCFKLFFVFTKKIDNSEQLNNNNAAMAILLIGFILGVMIIVRSAVSSAMDNLGLLLKQENPQFIIIVNIIIRIFLSYIFAGIFSFIIIWLSFLFFTIITTNIDELEEIKKSNSATALVLSTFMISAALPAQTPVTAILNSIVAAPAHIQSAMGGSLINGKLMVEGLLELPIWLLAVVFVFIIGYKIVPLLTKDIDEDAEIKNNNIAVALLVSSFIFGIMILINAALDPSYALIRTIINAKTITFALVAFSLLRIISFFIGAGVLALIMLVAALFFFMFLTRKINEQEELKKNNIAIGLVTALFVIVLALLMEHSISVLLSGFTLSGGSSTGLPVSM